MPTVEEFYTGKTINVAIAYSAGGGYDLYGRLVARHLGKHIPGKPNIVRAEHARRRQHAGGAAPLFGRAQGRH